MDTKLPPHPMQPLFSEDGRCFRFKENKIVRHLQEWSSRHGCDLNDLACLPFSNEDRQQFAQLIGYSLTWIEPEEES